MQDITSRDLKYQIIYQSKKNTYSMPNTYLTVPIPVSTGREYFSNPFVRKSYAALCTAYSSKQYSIPAVLLKYLPEENKYYLRSIPLVHFDFFVEEILAFHRNVIQFV